MKNEFFTMWFKDAIGSPPWDYQLDILRRKTPLCINKARQTGISTTVACLASAYSAFGGKKVLLVANAEDRAIHLRDYADMFLDSWRDILPGRIDDTKKKLTFTNGGELWCFAANPSTCRGNPAHLIIFDEFAHFRGEMNLDRKMLQAIEPSLAQLGGRTVILSTPFGQNNEFYRVWCETPSAWRITVNWRDCPNLNIVEAEQGGYWVLDKNGNPTTTAPITEEAYQTEYDNYFNPITGSIVGEAYEELFECEAWE